MASKTFEIRTEPHDATVGDTVLLFQPEVNGAVFASAYGKMRSTQDAIRTTARQRNRKTSNDGPVKTTYSPDDLVAITGAVKTFVATFLLDDDQRKVFHGLSLPDRTYVQLMEWCAELYGGGLGNGGGGGTSSG